MHDPTGLKFELELSYVFILPVPYKANELLTAKFDACLLFLLPEHFLNNGLRRDSGMITAGNPQCIVTPRRVRVGRRLDWKSSLHLPHAIPSDQSVLQRIGQGVAAVEGASDIRGRKGNNESPLLAGSVVLGLEEATLLPPSVPSCLNSFRVVLDNSQHMLL